MKLIVSSERNVPTWPSKPSATAEESRKPVGLEEVFMSPGPFHYREG